MTTTTNSAAASVSAIIKKNCSYDLLSNTLTITESFYKKSKVCGSVEAGILRSLLTENAGCKVSILESTKKTYKGLTLTLICDYIAIKSNYEALKVEMAEVKAKALEGQEDLSDKMADKVSFPLIKKWFLKKFKDFSVSSAQKEISDYKVEVAEKAAKAKVILMPQNQAAPAVNQ